MVSFSFSRIIFIDNTPIENLNHRDIKNRPIGASEHQLYSLIGELSKLNLDIICYNTILKHEIIDNVYYKNIEYLKIDTFLETDKFIVQRFCGLIPNVDKNNIFIWFHDHVCNNVINLSPLHDIKNSIDYIFNKKNIHFIFNSETSKEIYYNFFLNYGVCFEESRSEVIYNILYENDFNEVVDKKIQIDKNKIVFASAWCKGIHLIIELFRRIIRKNSELQLVLLSPGYDYHGFENYRSELEKEFKDRIQILGPLDKKTYCKVIKSVLCVISPIFFETFGCIFAESYYLGTPVIADIHSGAIKEIIDNNYIIDYSDEDIFLEKIKELQEKRDDLNIHLKNKFLAYENILLWKKFVILS